MNKFSRGSEWRAWDLHVHSPASHNVKATYSKFVIDLSKSECDVIGINDYFSVEGYAKIIELLASKEAPKELTEEAVLALEKLRDKFFFPVMEGRLDDHSIGKASDPDKNHPRLNFHLIFNPEISIEKIRTFIKSLEMTNEEMIGENYTNAKFLLDNCVVNLKATKEKAKKEFKDNFLVWLPYDEHGGFEPIDPKTLGLMKSKIAKLGDIIGSGKADQIDFFLGNVEKYNSDYLLKTMGKRHFLCIKGSDYHGDMGTRPIGYLPENKEGKRQCWIKADPTFKGLQIATYEPKLRGHIGDIPPKLSWEKDRLREHINSIKIEPVSSTRGKKGWFDNELSLNSSMAAIIGNKGSGKSALADIIALAGNSSKSNYFSFLTSKKFKDKQGRLSKEFKATLVWADGDDNEVSLNDNYDEAKAEKVKYFPQKYLELICGGFSKDITDNFQHELREVIFGHIPEDDRLNKTSLDELIEYITQPFKNTKSALKTEIRGLNNKIAGLRKQLLPQSKALLEETLLSINSQLKEHEKEKPKIIPDPSKKTGQSAKEVKASKSLASANKEKNDFEKTLDDLRTQRQDLKSSIAACERLIVGIKNIGQFISSQEGPLSADMTKTGLKFIDLISYTSKEGRVTKKQAEFEKTLNEVNSKLDENKNNSVADRLKKTLKEIEQLSSQLEAPSKKYQYYIKELNDWEKRKKELEGTVDQSGTKVFVEAELEKLKTLPKEIKDHQKSRLELSKEVHETYIKQRNVLKDLYAPVSALLKNHPELEKEAKKELALSFDANIIIDSFPSKFLDDFIDKGRAGTFFGNEEGAKELSIILDLINSDKTTEVVKFLSNIQNALEFDVRPDKKQTKMMVSSQLKKTKSEKELDDFLYCLEFLHLDYRLIMDGKDMSQLSPGERGMLLLLFFLLLDKDQCPLIVDQPEENIDSKTLFKLLSPAIKYAKENRQVIMVTHNPNIAIVCDAEQLIHCDIDRKNNNQVNYVSGAIEEECMNKLALDVLEGTRPSFDNRGPKYFTDK